MSAGKEERWRQVTLGLLLAVLWFEGGAAMVINLGVFFSLLLPDTAHRLLEIALVVSQLLTWALVGCLWHDLLKYTGRQLTRLAAPR